MTQPFVPAANTLAVEMIYGTWGGKAENVYHIQGSGPYTDIAGMAAAAKAAFLSWDNANLKAQRSSDYNLTLIRVRDVGQPNGAVWEWAVAQAGTAAPPTLPDNVTVAVKWGTGRGGRSYRGRTYHIGLTSSMVTADALTTAAAAAIPAAYNALIAAVSGMAWGTYGPTSGKLVVVSKRQNKTWLTGGAVVTPITIASLADSFVDSQRRRLKGRGS